MRAKSDLPQDVKIAKGGHAAKKDLQSTTLCRCPRGWGYSVGDSATLERTMNSNTTKQPPNILVLMTDQQSAEAMSCCLGRHHLHTPTMDRLAAEGIRFDQAYCAHPLCVPSRTSMFTGRYPHETGVLTNDDRSLDSGRFPCLAPLFKAHGYDTAYIGKWHVSIPDAHLPPVAGSPEQGFDFCENNHHNGADVRNSDFAIRFLNQKRDNPFFMVVSYNNPHNICEWARGRRCGLPDGDFALPPSIGRCPPLRVNHLPPEGETDTMALLRRSYQASPIFPVAPWGENEWREYAWAYYRMVELVDHHMGRVVAALEHLGLRENTLILFLSDHGDGQGAHRCTIFHIHVAVLFGNVICQFQVTACESR